VHAETAYLFRHALLRDAAYDLQLPGDRARLHELAFLLIEQAFGGRAPAHPYPDTADPHGIQPHPTDAVAYELAEHARLALELQASDLALPGTNCRPEAGLSPTLRMLYLHRAAEHSGRQFQLRQGEHLWRELATLWEGAARAEALRRAASMCFNMGNPKSAEHQFEHALTVAREAGHRLIECSILINLATVTLETGNPGRAEEILYLALAAAQETGNRHAEGVIKRSLGELCRQTSREEQGVKLLTEALEIHRAIGSTGEEGANLCAIGIVHQEADRLDEARQAFEEALAASRRSRNRRYEGVVLSNLAVVSRLSGDTTLADSLYQQALAIHREVGNRRSEGITRGNLGSLHAYCGRLDPAEKNLVQAIAIHRDVGNRRFEAVHLLALAWVRIRQGHFEHARKLWHEGSGILHALGDKGLLEHQSMLMREQCRQAGVPPLDSQEPGPPVPASN
jgi:tetratricopeptide (TPR) repeat protein